MAKKKKKKHFNFFKWLLIIILIGGCVYLYGTYIELKNYQVHEYKVVSKKITDNFNGFTIAHLSDIHYGKNFTENDLKKVVKMVNDFGVDIIVLTGDLIDKDTHMNPTVANKITRLLRSLKANNGKYIISGDDDIKFDEWENIVSDSGFMNLNNNYDTIYNKGYDYLFIAGIDTFANKEAIENKNDKAYKYLNSFEKNGPIYNILIMHEPDYIDELEDNKYDLILAGHSHAGQIRLPIIGALITPDGAKKYHDTHYKINNSNLYVSNGLGVSSYSFRLFNTPSFNVYRLVKNK